jgi:hypothetical protein
VPVQPVVAGFDDEYHARAQAPGGVARSACRCDAARRGGASSLLVITEKVVEWQEGRAISVASDQTDPGGVRIALRGTVHEATPDDPARRSRDRLVQAARRASTGAHEVRVLVKATR